MSLPATLSFVRSPKKAPSEVVALPVRVILLAGEHRAPTTGPTLFPSTILLDGSAFPFYWSLVFTVVPGPIRVSAGCPYSSG